MNPKAILVYELTLREFWDMVDVWNPCTMYRGIVHQDYVYRISKPRRDVYERKMLPALRDLHDCKKFVGDAVEYLLSHFVLTGQLPEGYYVIRESRK